MDLQEQKRQEEEYNYPYHYIPEFRNYFSPLKDWTWSFEYISAIEFILNQIKKDENFINSIADVGCGDGRLTKELSFDFPKQKVIGIDFSNKAIELAKAINPDLNFLNLDIINNNINNKYDAITLVEVFEHIPLDKCSNFVNALYEILNKNGVIYLTVPHKNKPLSYKHFQHFSLKSLENFFKEKFIIKKVVYIQKNSIFLNVIKLITHNKLYVITNKTINNRVYNLYKKYFFYTTKDKCGRIYLKLQKK